MAWLACGVPDVWLVTSSWFAIRRKASLTLFSTLCSYWFRSSVDVPKNYLFRSGKRTAILVLQKERPGETGDWKQPLRLACYVSFWHMIHFDGHFTLSSQRGQEFATHRVWYEFNIFLTSDYKKRWWDLYITPSTEYWNCKVGFGFSSWMLVVQLACCSIGRMLRAQFSRTSNHVKCWEFKLNY